MFPKEMDSEHLEDGLTDEDRRSLCVKPTLEEVQEAVFNIDPDSVADPDGFRAVFFHTCWEIISEDVFGVVTEFFRGVEMPNGFTAITISLISKTANPTCWSKYRPISLCNVTNKICTKLMTIRLRHVLPKVLRRKGFPQRWIGLVANAVSHCWFSVLVNDRLFAAHPMMYYQAPGRIWVSHLAYVDDLMIFTTTCQWNMELLRDFLRAYERMSGQLINGMKSSFIVGRQVSSLQTQAVQYVLGYQLKHLPGWAMTNLSYGGRLALIRSVLQATPLHLLQVIHPPKSILTTIERIFNGFFWGSYNGRKHIHWSSWGNAWFSVAESGLGVRSLADYVRAISMKLWGQFRSKSSL
ncbi:hypothetical protein Sango_1036500 [Sesamum angolense]|uniref:Reverse transcriptase domain-containing protein n=1 Tax=Sesamum angolense TaxID=2727404 RepID=A0AAE1X0Z8_9LAMI|nr:hypothetical protein Sango_1036500 [Sesamum angolense]